MSVKNRESVAVVYGFNIPGKEFSCDRCGQEDVIPSVDSICFPKNWAIVTQNNSTSHYCRKCAKEIGIGV